MSADEHAKFNDAQGAASAAQEVREGVARREGAERFRSMVQVATEKGEASRVGAAQHLLRRMIVPTTAAFEALLLDAKSRGGARHEALQWVERAGAHTAAFLVVKAALDVHGQRAVLVAGRAAEYIADEVRFRAFKETEELRFRAVMHRFRTKSKRHQRQVLNGMAKRSGVLIPDDLKSDHSRRLRVGMKLLDVLAQATGMFTVRHVTSGSGHRNGTRTQTYFDLVPEALALIEHRNELLELLDPVYRPMVTPPLDWGPGQRGGYAFGLKGMVPLVRGAPKDRLAVVEKTDMPEVYAAVNAMQATAWEVNQDVFAVYEALLNGATLPEFYEHDLPEPPKPHDIDTNAEARKVWRTTTGETKTLNHLRMIRRVAFQRLVSDATSIGEGPCYFVYNLDFRGRVYPVTTYLSPQGPDEVKALLRFRKAKKLGAHGEAYLAIHGANMLSLIPGGPRVSTLTLDERCAWIREHTGDIRAVARDPFRTTWWQSAKKPMQFLAFCFEWDRLEQWCDTGRSAATFWSRLPIAQDGSCNGVQHFSAMMRDPLTGFTVNLIPSARPNDLYQSLSDAVIARLHAEVGKNPWAKVWLESGLVDRDLTKRPTMTYGYGSVRYGFAEQIRDYVRTHKRWEEVKDRFLIDGQGLTRSSRYMSELIWDILQEKARAAAVAMDWMRTSVRAVVQSGAPVRWIVPGTGFPVDQAYTKSRMIRVETILNGRTFMPKITASDSTKLDPHKQQNAIAPNVVHSFDAACLMRTVLRAHAAGVTSFGMVHDSYATVAGDAAILARCTREAFVNYYESFDVMEGLYQQWLTLSGDELDLYPPPPPSKGDLDLRGVLDSAFFFS